MRCEWEKVETFMSTEMNYLGSGGHACERTCEKREVILRKQSGSPH